MSARTDRNRTKIIALLGAGHSHREIAQIVGCSTKTVQRINKSVQPELSEANEGQLQEYQKRLRQKLPIGERAELYAKIARKANTNPFAAMRSLERIDELDGLITPKDRLRQNDPAPQTSQPMFVLPPGSAVNVTVNQLVSPARREIDVTPADPSRPQEIDVTPTRDALPERPEGRQAEPEGRS